MSQKFLLFIICFLLVMLVVVFLQVKQTPCTIPYFNDLGKAPLESFPKAIFNVPVENQKFLRIGFIGETHGNPEQGEAFNETVLKKLLNVLKKRDVQAVFFMGNLVSGVNKKGENQLPSQLEAFNQVVEKTLGGIPFFPTLGDTEMASPEGASIFKKQFRIENSIAFSEHLFAYMVSIKNTFFVVIPTDEYDVGQKSVQPTFNPLMLVWLQNVLQEAAKNYKYVFVVGHEPAFPAVSSVRGVRPHERDAFWKILADAGVLAYFASQEHVFDRSNRHQVWQIISGGGGAPMPADTTKNPFFHCLLLTIPLESKEPPQIEILDTNGEINDEFELAPSKSVLYQMHISQG